MKLFRPMLAGVLLLTAVAGCHSAYVIQLNNGQTVMAASRPKYDKERGSYVYKDAYGREMAVPGMRVRSISPANDKSDAKDKKKEGSFNSPTPAR